MRRHPQRRAGDLSARISYVGQDEFAPVCGAFNEMAARLQESIARTCRDEAGRKEPLAGISHDLRSPLTSIRAYVEGLLDGVARTPDRQRQYLETIRAKAEDIDRLVSQLFHFSQLELERYPLLLQNVELSQWLPQLVGGVREDYLRQSLAIRMELSPAAVQADPEQLRRVLLNLLGNSAKYKEQPEGTEEITMTAWEAEVSLCVADDGPGVPEDALPKLLDASYRSDPARKNPAGAVDWALQLRPKRRRIWADRSAPATGPPAGSSSKSPYEGRLTPMRKILIVEDDGDIASIERDYLELNGYQVEIAPDGASGLARGRGGEFDLILLDLMLPGVDGFSVCRQLREKTDIPILMVTARREDIDKSRGLGLGADDYIEKPFSPGVLVARVNAHAPPGHRVQPGGAVREDLWPGGHGGQRHRGRPHQPPPGKAGAGPGHPRYIQTACGAGYRFRAQ